MRIRFGELQQLFEISDPSGGWKYFHVTHNDLGRTHTFTPSIPTWVNDCQAEDFTTPRVCLSTSVASAVHGKFGDPHPKHFGQPEMFIYASKRIPKLQVPMGGRDISTPDNLWGNDWQYSIYAEENGLDPSDEDQHAEVVKGRISDDPEQTKEVWSLAPITMSLVGRLWPNDVRNPTKILQKNLLRPAEDDDDQT